MKITTKMIIERIEEEDAYLISLKEYRSVLHVLMNNIVETQGKWAIKPRIDEENGLIPCFEKIISIIEDEYTLRCGIFIRNIITESMLETTEEE